jgi:hypothetical protein
MASDDNTEANEHPGGDTEASTSKNAINVLLDCCLFCASGYLPGKFGLLHGAFC